MKNFVILLTGISGSGKTTIAEALKERLLKDKFLVDVIDGDKTRDLLENTIGHDKGSRDLMGKINRIIGYYLQKNSINVIYALVCPYESIRDQFRRFFGDSYIEIYVKSNVEKCRERDVKGLYKEASDGRLAHFNGTNAIFEQPANSNLIIDTDKMSIEEEVEVIYGYLWRNSFI